MKNKIIILCLITAIPITSFAMGGVQEVLVGEY